MKKKFTDNRNDKGKK